jgi:hypothetical protein
MPIYGQAKQYTQQIGDPQTFIVQKERTINDVRQSRLVLLEGISNAIGFCLKADDDATNLTIIFSFNDYIL